MRSYNPHHFQPLLQEDASSDVLAVKVTPSKSIGKSAEPSDLTVSGAYKIEIVCLDFIIFPFPAFALALHQWLKTIFLRRGTHFPEV